MTPEYFFNQLRIPINLKPIGPNHTRDEITDEITVYGRVFDDWQSKKIIRICFTLSSERCMIVERTLLPNGRPKYKTVFNARAIDIELITEFITKNYL